MARRKQEPTQKTQPKTGEPAEIPVPRRGEFFGNLVRAVHADPEKVEPKPKRKK